MIVGFIGSGNMAAAMARGWAASANGPTQMLFTDSGSGRATALADEVEGRAVDSNENLVEGADFVVLAMKPKDLADVAASIPSPFAVMSLLGGTALATLFEQFPDSTVIRLMPNLAVETGRGVIAAAHPQESDPKVIADGLALLESLGKVVELDDSLMDAATAVMGCSPAYFAVVADALAKAGIEDGLEPEDALTMVAETLSGTAELLKRRTPFEIQVAVASPGGSTEAGLEALAAGGAAEAFEQAAISSLRRMREG
ncbi:MAG: pyrroline-5-carboxylate reductase [Solirubrobacterales bacterium]|nr:pyrroline-5-carboxylate reductase [Solirubrobacterales bacterium]